MKHRFIVATVLVSMVATDAWCQSNHVIDPTIKDNVTPRVHTQYGDYYVLPDGVTIDNSVDVNTAQYPDLANTPGSESPCCYVYSHRQAIERFNQGR